VAPRRYLAPLLAATGMIVQACGDESSGVHQHEQTDGEISAQAVEMRASEEFGNAREAMHACLKAMGYQNVGTPDLVLLDGSTIPPGRRYVRGALLDYEIHREECAAQSGFSDVVAKFGLADKPPDPRSVHAANAQQVAQMDCLAKKGYTIPEPKVLRGFLQFDFPVRSSEEQVAYLSDITDCNREIWGTDFPPAY
jgi:hypothetical protein